MSLTGPEKAAATRLLAITHRLNSVLQRRFGPDGKLSNAAGIIEISFSFVLSMAAILLIRFTHADQGVVLATLVILPVNLAILVVGFVRVFEGEKIRKLTLDERPTYPDDTWLVRKRKAHPIWVGIATGLIMSTAAIVSLTLLYGSPDDTLLVLTVIGAVVMSTVMSIAMVQANRARADH